jgi:signal transduction histidine kinase
VTHRWRAASHRLRHSLKWRLVGMFLLLALGTTITFVYGVREIVAAVWTGYGRPLTANYLDLLTAEIGTPPDVAKAQALTQRLPIAIRIEGPAVNWDSRPQDAGREHGPRWGSLHGDWTDSEMHRFHVRELPDGHRITYSLTRPETLGSHVFGWGTLAMLLLLTWFAWRYARRLLRPLDDIREGAVRFGRGDFAHRIALRRNDELGDLARQVNTMAGEIQQMLDAKRALLLAISHELRSPLTRARVNAELVEEGEARDALLHDLGEMRDMVIDLLEGERLATGHAALQREPTELNALVTESASDDVRLDLGAGMPALPLDRVRMRLLLRNLVDNARRHNDGAQAPVELSTRREGERVTLSVRDHGPGVADDQLGRLAEPFHRPDAARRRSTGGVGLGLYLCRLVAEAHGGTLRIENAKPGLRVVVILPGAA